MRPPEIRVHRSVRRALRIFDADRLRWLDEAVSLGPLVAMRMGPVRVWVVTDSAAARTMLQSDSESWIRPPALVVPIRVGVGENLFTQSEKAWAELQPAVAPAFRRRALDERLASIDALVADEVSALPLDHEVDLELAMGRIALILAAWVLLGERLDSARAESFARHQREVVAWVGVKLGKLSGILPFASGARGRAMRRERAELRAYADEVIARARDNGHADDDVLGALLRARPRGRALTEEELRGHVLGLLLAGNETTAAALSWALVQGARHPAAWAAVAADPARAPHFVSETLRLTPAVWGIPRTPAKAGVTLAAGGVSTRVRRGQVATVYLRGINRDPRLWPDPLRFDPDRHDAPRTESADGPSPRVLIPFGLGPRGCIGQHLALAEMHAVVPALARKGSVAVPDSISEDASFAMRVRGGLTGRFTAPDPSGAELASS
jgi:cytochrome P450